MSEPRNDLGYGDVGARPDLATDSTPKGGGGQSGGGARPGPAETTDGAGSPGGQTDPAYRGGDNPNAPRRGGDNVQSGTSAGSETERDAPGIASDKRGDDVR